MIRRKLHRLLHHVRYMSRVQIKQRWAARENEHEYRDMMPFGRSEVHRTEGARFAVVIHLYYTENWPLFVEKLAHLSGYLFDVFITMPGSNVDFIDEVYRTYPNANIFLVPNRGRDVLPFIKTMQLIKKSEYEWVLKFHSKKSTHREDGQQWLEGMLNALLPTDSHVMANLMTTMEQGSTGIVGPAGVYYPLTVNFPANGEVMTRVVARHYGKDVAYRYLQAERDQYGFFGGTMFWARVDAISNLIKFPAHYFEDEAGQIDATFAHALERLFCLIPEIDGKVMYEIDSESLRQRDYVSGNIPDWSLDHDK